MRTAARRLLTLGAVITALLLGATHASAGGPTSVLISNPATQSAAALYTTEADYTTLLEALEPGETAPNLGPGNPGRSSINITWLVHDVAIWRIDFVRLDSDGQVWVQTNEAPADGSVGVGWEDGEWHAAADPGAVRDVLERAGVLSADSSTAAEAAADTAEDEVAPVATEARDASGDALTGWWWLLPGAALGIALGLGARPVATELARRREPGPRHQLIG